MPFSEFRLTLHEPRLAGFQTFNITSSRNVTLMLRELIRTCDMTGERLHVTVTGTPARFCREEVVK